MCCVHSEHIFTLQCSDTAFMQLVVQLLQFTVTHHTFLNEHVAKNVSLFNFHAS